MTPVDDPTEACECGTYPRCACGEVHRLRAALAGGERMALPWSVLNDGSGPDSCAFIVDAEGRRIGFFGPVRNIAGQVLPEDCWVEGPAAQARAAFVASAVNVDR